MSAAIFGGYALAAVFSTFFSYILPTSRAEAAMSGLLLSFAVYAATILCAFGARSISRMWTGMILLTAGFGLLAILLKLARGP
ncbi:iron transporter [Nitrobacter sp.]|uniref:iron transporter n=1 Tax=Nitrobacter sp. TaxID=29420 RepID=UPI001AC4CFA4|nr:iron transporter [Nitrobacter sp.]MBN9489898.1 iron transporter [Alphaproteobacteria bacterium]